MVSEEDFKGRDIVSISDFSTEEINYILDFSKYIKENPFEFRESMKGRLMASLFFERSTRTDCSFQAAMYKMSGNVLDFDVETSSIGKGETFRDTIKTLECYEPDIFVIRHNRDGEARFSADILNIPVINAGDGKNQHPTQTLLDLYTIKELRGDLPGTRIAMAGDLRYGRTVHSLALALSKYGGCEMFFVSPDFLKMPEDLLDKLRQSEVKFLEKGIDGLKEAIGDFPIVYMTRIQRERFPEGFEGDQIYKEASKNYCLTLDMLRNAHPDLKILHPLPKIDEIDSAVDDTKYAHYFQQLKNGLHVRKSLLSLLIGREDGK